MQLRTDFIQADRQAWMKELALANFAELEILWQQFTNKPEFKYLRATDSGLLQVQGKLGNTGDRFNMGDITITRSSISLANGINGFAFVQGRNKQHADLAAIIDAIMQSDLATNAQTALIAPLQAARLERLKTATAATLQTKVDFFTLVRGEDE